VLDEARELHPCVQEGTDDLAEAVVPFVRERLREHDVGVDVGAGFVPDERLGGLEVRVVERQHVRALTERPEHGMALAHEEAPARSQEVRDDAAPPTDVGQPAQRSHTREDEVEAPRAEHVDRGVEIRLDELDAAARLLCEPTRHGERGGREVEPRHPGAEPAE
jgi:hypothetical protein